MAYPTIIAGPALIQFNSQTYYTEGDVTVSLRRDTFNVATSLHGTIDTRLASQMVEIGFKPVGALDTVAKYIAHQPGSVGSLLINQASPKAVVVWGADGVKQTWHNGFISKLPEFTLSATKTAIGAMALTCLGDPTKTLTNAAAWQTTASASLSDTSFDETKIVTPAYTAALGSVFTGLAALDGFTFTPSATISMKKVDNYGVVNAMLTDLTYACRFTPVGLTEAQLWAACKLQDTTAIIPGASVTGSDDLVISAGAVSFTLAKAGIVSALTQYGLEPLRLGEVAFVNRKTFTSGALNAPITVAFS